MSNDTRLAPEIKFSVMTGSSAGIQFLLNRFEAEHHIHVRLHLLSWDSALDTLIKAALHNDGPDLSEIGSTWLGDLVNMNALRPFLEPELDALGRQTAFLPSVWPRVMLAGPSQVWAIPWVASARLLFFRRGLLDKAGLDASTAFQNAEQLSQTLGHLQEHGVKVPWTVPTSPTHLTLHNIASWVWGAGGDLVSEDGRQTWFGRPEAHAGMRAYFALGRFLAPSVRRLSGLEPDGQFLNDADTAITMSGPWLLSMAGKELKEQMGVGLPPGPPLVWGSHLAIWRHSAKPDLALKLIEYLTRPSVQAKHSQNIGLLPTRLDALAEPPFSTDPAWQVATRALGMGRSFPVTRTWGVIEKRLTAELGALWADVLANPGLNLDAVIGERMSLLAERLDLALA